jgi:outer membrane receptor for ferrienterochelin and colicins
MLLNKNWFLHQGGEAISNKSSEYFRYLLFSILMAGSTIVQAQKFSGKVVDTTTSEPLIGATLLWQGSDKGTATDVNGEFTLDKISNTNSLIVSYIGYETDTLQINGSYLEIKLVSGKTLDGVVVKGASSGIDMMEPRKIEVISAKELQKAACCNLSESFETNASVDVSYTDAVSGAKQIKMLGLDGNYTQIISENLPNIRGLATPFGLSYIPGSWIESIDLGKGAGSVVNGYESMAGIINVELKKPDNSDPFFLNLYLNSMGRAEINVDGAKKWNEKWSTGVMLHGSNQSFQIDMNEDGFMNAPQFTQINGIARAKYSGDRYMGQYGIKILNEDRFGGQMGFTKDQRGSSQIYGTGFNTRRVEIFTKNGVLFPATPYRGIGIVANATRHEQDAFFGLNSYAGVQQTLYVNSIYQSIIGNTNHQFRTGLSYMYDEYREVLIDSAFNRMESVPGAFYEYSYMGSDQFTLVAGMRGDFHNLFGLFWTPRLHLKYEPVKRTSVRANVGRGYRVPNGIAENLPLLISSRRVSIEPELKPEIAWNYGLSLTQQFRAANRNGSIDFEFFRTDFENQLIIDRDANPNLLRFYNLEGQSFANSFQVELTYEILPSLDFKTAYKYYDVRATINGELREIPFVSKHRYFANIGYATKFDIWKFDLTAKWAGSQRFPDFPAEHMGHFEETTPSFWNINAQVTKTFRKWDLYVGVENLTNFMQMDMILGANDPFGTGFDAGNIWGPVIGRMFYTGMRFNIN